MRILVVNGPNLNLLGIREVEIYGTVTYEELVHKIIEYGRGLQLDVDVVQSNCEGKLIDYVHDARLKYDGIIINGGAYSHYSYALRDAISAVNLPTVNVHLSDPSTREEFRHHDVLRDVCLFTYQGLGISSYFYALEHLKRYLC